MYRGIEKCDRRIYIATFISQPDLASAHIMEIASLLLLIIIYSFTLLTSAVYPCQYYVKRGK